MIEIQFIHSPLLFNISQSHSWLSVCVCAILALTLRLLELCACLICLMNIKHSQTILFKNIDYDFRAIVKINRYVHKFEKYSTL